VTFEAPANASPPLQRQVTLSLPGLEEVPARVTGKGEGFTELVLLARPRTALLDHTQLLQRRAHARTDCIAAVIVTAEGRAPQRGLTLNLSGGGLLVRGLSGLQVGDELGFDLRLDLLPARIQGRCRVVRVTPDGFHGVQFSEMDEGERDRLVRFAYQREKAAREARLGY